MLPRIRKTMPAHPHLTDPATGDPLRAIGVLPSGRIVWPILGGSGEGGEGGNDGGDDEGGKPGGDGGDDDGDKGGDKGGKPDDDDRGAGSKAAVLADLAKERKARQELAAKVKEYEDAKLTEEQRRERDLGDYKTRAESSEAKLNRLEIALAKAPEGMAPARVLALSKRLTGSTREELEADADELFAEFGGTSSDGKGGKPPAGKPRERLRGGSDPEDEPEETDPAKLAAKVRRGY